MLMTLDWTKVRDPRRGSCYALPPLVIRATLAALAGARTLRETEAWNRRHHGALNALIGTRWKRSPSRNGWHKTLRALGRVDLTPALVEGGGTAALHVDGKALRGSVKGHRAMQMLLSVFTGERVVAMLPFGKGHEPAAARAALAALQAEGSLAGCWVTFDAAHTQKNG